MKININDFVNNPKGSLTTIERKPLLQQTLVPKELFSLFQSKFQEIEGREFSSTEENKAFVFTLIYFFQKKENFYNSSLLFEYPNTKIDINKGLVIVGGFGCGKTSILRVFQQIINDNNRVNLKFTTTVDAVSKLESIEAENMYDFKERLYKGHLIIDDLLAEKQASRFGKSELFEEVLFQRLENKKMNSIITMNYDSEHPNNIEYAINKLSRYGGRVFDRILGNFNFIELHGKSFRI
jgi:DNA replication protein DnaC